MKSFENVVGRPQDMDLFLTCKAWRVGGYGEAQNVVGVYYYGCCCSDGRTRILEGPS